MKKIEFVLNMDKEKLKQFILKTCPHTFGLTDDFHEINCKGDCNLCDDKCLCYLEDDSNDGCIQCWNKEKDT